jgi:hypothetical protein
MKLVRLSWAAKFGILMLKENKDLNILSIQELSTLENGKEASEMVRVSKYGPTVPGISETGETIRLMEKENSSTLMVTFTKVTGPTIKRTVVVLTNMSTVPCTKACGRMISNTVRESRPGLTNRDTMETTSSDASMESVLTNGTTNRNILVTGAKTKYLELESTLGSMADATKVNGSITTWKAWEFISGTMEESTKASIRMIRSMASVCTPGLMADAMRDTGTKESNMDLANI